jgi:biopolymer transport protein ExbB/TolQ
MGRCPLAEGQPLAKGRLRQLGQSHWPLADSHPRKNSRERLTVGIDVKNSGFESNVRPTESAIGEEATEPNRSQTAGNAALAALTGTALNAGFYSLVYATSWEPLKRYFLGHPIAIAATILFWFAVAVLFTKWLDVLTQVKQLNAIRDEDLLPPTAEESPAGRWLTDNDAGFVSKRWLQELCRLPTQTRKNRLVSRLEELLTRQSQRGTTKHLADDLRELSGRDADVAHDSLGLVRIIIWAIPMLGFLGTVIGITQTLGGLDFANGSAAVENLKSGLYVAFDTTALGLVLSVVAIFVQFPIERSEQRLLADIDARVGHLVSASLPSDETSDNQTALIADLCRGVQAAVAESLDNQTRLWARTIDEAQLHWQRVQEDSANKISEALERTLLPALNNHAASIAGASEQLGTQIVSECDRWHDLMTTSHQASTRTQEQMCHQLLTDIETRLSPALTEHAKTIKTVTDKTSLHFDEQCQHHAGVLTQHSDQLKSVLNGLSRQYEELAETQGSAAAVTMLQKSLDSNLQRLVATNASVDRSVAAAGGDGMADAMRILARAVDVLSTRIASPSRPADNSTSRQAA